MTQIVQSCDRWNVQGDLIVDTVNSLLQASQSLVLGVNTVADFKDVNEIDTAAISLILEWKRRANRENKELSLVNLPENLKSLVALYGVSDIMT